MRLTYIVCVAFLAAAVTLAMLPTKVYAITYATTYANPGDAPIYGTMIDPSDYYHSDNGDGVAAKASGNALDLARVYIYDNNPSSVFMMMKWDMGFNTSFVRVYPNVEHGDGNAWDYLQWSLWGSNTGVEDPNAWVLLWDPTSTSGSNVNDFVVTHWNGVEPTTIYRYGSPLGPDDLGDAFTIDFNLPQSYRYFGLRVSTLAISTGGADPEIDAVATRAAFQALSVSISPPSVTIQVSQPVPFTSNVSGGSSPYSYQWYLNDAPVSGANAGTWAFTPTTAGTYYVYLKVTDAKSNTAQSETARAMVTMVPVGGYSVSLTRGTSASQTMTYLSLVALFGAVLSLRKRIRKSTPLPS